MKKRLLYLAMLFLSPAALLAQQKPQQKATQKPAQTAQQAPSQTTQQTVQQTPPQTLLPALVTPMIRDTAGLENLPGFAKSGCSNCLYGMGCDGTCCMYPTNETIGQLNYIIYDNRSSINDLHFKFEVTKEFTAEYDELTNNCNASRITQKLNSTQGIVFQFNCYSKDAPNALVQYFFYVQGTDIYPHIQYAGGTPDHNDHDWQPHNVKSPYGLVLTKANSLAPGFVLEVELSTDDNSYVDKVTFTVTEPNGKKHVQTVDKQDLFPLRISEFQTNIVSTNGHYVHFATGGEGTLTYSSKGRLCIEGGNYPHTANAWGDFNGGTCETSNASYGKLSSCCSPEGGSFSQSVTVK